MAIKWKLEIETDNPTELKAIIDNISGKTTVTKSSPSTKGYSQDMSKLEGDKLKEKLFAQAKNYIDWGFKKYGRRPHPDRLRTRLLSFVDESKLDDVINDLMSEGRLKIILPSGKGPKDAQVLYSDGSDTKLQDASSIGEPIK
jgi:hypothetical protein